MRTLFVTGARGRMGRELLPQLEQFKILAPTRAELELTDPRAVHTFLERETPDLVLHLAAYTDVAKAESEREKCYAENVLTVRNLVRSSGEVKRFVHISTDYVFNGERGGYREDESVAPANYYSLTKALGEEAARGHPRALVVRTSFKTAPWAYPKAFTDQFTSADFVDVIALELKILLENLERVPLETDTLHIGTERKSVFELAVRRTPEVQPMSRADVKVHIPPDVSLDTSRWEALKATFTP